MLTLAPLYDWNGNVMGYADGASGQVRHRFEYDAFGQELSVDSFVSAGAGGSTSAHSSPPPVRFSSKYTDAETGLVYYGYRSYSPQLGRWLSRDPIEERGGTNLYGMVGNDPVNAVDVLGLDRKIVGLSHLALEVDDWICSEGKWKKADTRTRYEFGPSNTLVGVLALVVWVPGEIFVTGKQGSVIGGAPTDACADNYLHRFMLELRSSDETLWYHVLGYNCRDFIDQVMATGIGEDCEECDCN
jgi:RHS repeat-associated protein